MNSPNKQEFFFAMMATVLRLGSKKAQMVFTGALNLTVYVVGSKSKVSRDLFRPFHISKAHTMSSHWEEFYATHLPPTDFEDNRSLLKEFVDRHYKSGQRIVLITVRVNSLG